MTFHIGSQSGGTFNNVAGSQHITGGQQTHVTSVPAQEALRELRQALATVRLDSRTVARVDAELTEIENAVQPERPDRDRAARATERLTGLLTAAGAFVTAGGALIRPLQALATWLGPLGQQVLAMIPGLR
jgi:hypothetical protein